MTTEKTNDLTTNNDLTRGNTTGIIPVACRMTNGEINKLIENHICPECGAGLQNGGNCPICTNCGWSRC